MWFNRTYHPRVNPVVKPSNEYQSRPSLNFINGTCLVCDSTGLTSSSFKDALSLKEYRQSGLCQKCQDNFFDTELDEEIGI